MCRRPKDKIVHCCNKCYTMNIYPLFIIIFLFPFVKSDVSCDKSSNQVHYKLRDDLLCDYDEYIRPAIEHKNATEIVLKLLIKNFIYDTHAGMLTLNTWAVMHWQDDHLKWNPSDYENIDELNIYSNWIWTPDLSTYNRFDQSGEVKIFKTTVECWASNEGTVTCIVPVTFETLCTADLTNFPYDIQACELYIGSWVYKGEILDFQLNDQPVALDELTSNPEWDLLNVSHERHDGIYDCCPNSTYPMAIYTFTIQRRSAFHDATVIIPSLGLIAMCLIVQFMDIRETERFMLTICNIICHTMFMQYISWQVPSVGENVPRMILFGRDSLIIGLIQLSITIVLRNLTKTQEDSWISDVISRALDSRIGHAVLVSDFRSKGTAKTGKCDDADNITEHVDRNIQKDQLLFAKLVDRLCFVIYFFTYFIMFISLVL